MASSSSDLAVGWTFSCALSVKSFTTWYNAFDDPYSILVEMRDAFLSWATVVVSFLSRMNSFLSSSEFVFRYFFSALHLSLLNVLYSLSNQGADGFALSLSFAVEPGRLR